MKIKKLLALMITIVMVATLFGGCAKDKKTENTSKEQKPTGTVTKGADATGSDNGSIKSAADAAAKFPIKVTNDNASIEGGTLKVALVADSAFAGILNRCFYEDDYDDQILKWFTESIISSDDNFTADQDGAATYEYDTKAKTITLHMKEGVKWHDGEPVTLDDLVYAYEVLSDKDYEGFRYDQNVMNIEGVKEYHAGKAKKISGLELSKDKMTLVIHFINFYPSILVGGFWTYPIPRHYYGDMAVKDMPADAKTRKNPIGFGPFKVKNIVPGESVELERFDDYWQGKPKLDGVTISVVKPELVPAAMKEGKYDIAEFSTQQYPDYKEPTNYQYLGEVETVFNYTGFKLGKWDADKTECIYNPDSKMANVKLRQAIGYALDNQTLAENLYNGLRFPATSIITPRHSTYQDKNLTGFSFDKEKSKQLLEEAGYKDVDGDGYREDPKGNKFTITWAAMDGENADAIAQFKMQCWKDVGLKVELYNGRLTEFNAFYDAVQKDDPKIDMYDAAWDTGFDPNPGPLWGRETEANYTRYTSNTFDSIIKDISSDQAWDTNFMTQKYKEWQEAFFNEAPAIPTIWRITLTATNNRVKNYEVTNPDIKGTYHLIELTANETMK